MRLTPQKWNQLVNVNADVNQQILAATDDEIYGRPEVWAYPEKIGEGDCEDLVLLKRRDLIKDGWPAGALLITVVRQRNGDGHAVLTVLTDRGDLVLDNLNPRVLVWNERNTHTSSGSRNSTAVSGSVSTTPAESRWAACAEGANNSHRPGPGRVPPPVPKIRSLRAGPRPGAGSLFLRAGDAPGQALPISIPVAKTSRPPMTIWKAARRKGVSM